MKSVDGDVKFSVIDMIIDFFSTPFRMAENGVDVTDGIDLDPKSSDRTEAYLAKNLEQLENTRENTQTIEDKGRIPGIKVDNISLENTRQEQEMPKQTEQVREVKALDEK